MTVGRRGESELGVRNSRYAAEFGAGGRCSGEAASYQRLWQACACLYYVM